MKAPYGRLCQILHSEAGLAYLSVLIGTRIIRFSCDPLNGVKGAYQDKS